MKLYMYVDGCGVVGWQPWPYPRERKGDKHTLSTHSLAHIDTHFDIDMDGAHCI